MGDDQLFHKQLDDLYVALENGDTGKSVGLIGQIGDTKNTLALEPLLILLEYSGEQIRSSSAVALGRLGMVQAVEPLIKALNDPSVIVQEQAAIALGLIGDERATGALENVTPEHSAVKTAAESSLLRIGSKNNREPLFRKNVAGGRPVIGMPSSPAIAGGSQASSAGSAAPAANKTVSPPADVSSPTRGMPVTELKKSSDGAIEELPQKSTLLAAVASFLIPGLGQLYNGEKITKALLFSIGFFIGSMLLIVPGILVWLYGIYDAYSTARKINAGELPNRKPDLLMMLILVAVIMAMVVLTVIMAAVIAAFVFQLGTTVPDSSPDSHFDALPSIGTNRIDQNTVRITNLGGGDDTLTGLRVIANATEIRPISGKLTPESESSGVYTVGMNVPVTVIADFGTDQVVVFDMAV